MKRIIRVCLCYLLLMCSYINGSAQAKTNSSEIRQRILYGVGIDAGIITGSLRDIYRYYLGGSLGIDVPIASKLCVTGSAGFQNFFYRNDSYHGQKSTNDLQLLPLKAGLRYFPIGIFYIQAEAGVSFLLNKSSTDFDRSAAFIYAPQAGVQFKVARNNWIDAGVRYERSSEFLRGNNESKINFLGLRVAYTFTLRRRK